MSLEDNSTGQLYFSSFLSGTGAVAPAPLGFTLIEENLTSDRFGDSQKVEVRKASQGGFSSNP